MNDQDLLEKFCEFFKSAIEQSKNGRVYNKKDALDLKDELDLTIPAIGQENKDQLISDLNLFAQNSLKTMNPGFLNQLYSSSSLPSLFGEITAAIFNTSMATYEIAPMATLIELEVIDTLKKKIGFNDGEGIMLTGGSNANLVALLAARNIYFPESKEEGNPDGLCCFISDQAHYSFSKAVNIIGLGRKNLIKVKSHPDGKMDTSDLDFKIQKAIDDGKRPFFVCATAGTTVKGAFDPIDKIKEVCNRYDLWLHIDGAWGGSVALSESHNNLLKGVELADSFTWDAHKLMSVPLICSFIFFKEKGILDKSHSGGGGEYIFHENDNQNFDLGRRSLQCGRKIDSLKIWLALRFYGLDGFSKNIDHFFKLRDYTLDKISQRNDCELVYQPEFLNLCFKTTNDNKNTSLDFRNFLMQEGHTLVNFSWDEQENPFIRLVLNNINSTTDSIDLIFKQLDQFHQNL